MDGKQRITFSRYDMEHLYDLAFENFQDECVECQRLKRRVEKFLGQRIVKTIKRNNKKFPY